MKKLKECSLKELISTDGIKCECGKIHKMPIKRVEVGENALNSVPEILNELNIKKPFIICDQNTSKAAFPLLMPIFEENKIPYGIFQFEVEHLEPDEHAIGSIIMGFDQSCDGILAVGSGVINDLGKVIASTLEKPLATVATAPSMDGYGSNNASMIQNRLKVSLYYHCPEAIIADTRILQAAPFEMLQAGVGDMLAKYSSICEWRISHLITGEYYCENIADLVRDSLNKILNLADDLLKRDAKAVEEVFIGLLYTGLAMGYAGISRPASGLEHYFSHVWEMMNLERNKPSKLHGIQVAVGTLYTFQIWEELKKYKPDRQKANDFMQSFDDIKWQAMVHRIYGEIAAPNIIKTAQQEGRNDPELHQKRLNLIIDNWDQILEIVNSEMPEYERILSLMNKFSLPLSADDIGFSQKDAHDALIASREVRNKYVTSSLLWDLGLLYDIEFPKNSGFMGLE